MNKIGIIITREFNERVRKKSFLITTILMPLLMIGLMVAPSLMMLFAKGEQKSLVVIDQSGIIAPQLEGDEEITFTPMDVTLEEARADSNIFEANHSISLTILFDLAVDAHLHAITPYCTILVAIVRT